jgi:polyhydroxybutyrate depolymerase
MARATAASSSPVRGAIEFGGIERTYVLHLPTTIPSGRRVPLVVLLHEHFGTGAGTMSQYGVAGIADRYGFIVVAPDGVGREWNDGRTGMPGTDDVGFVATLIASLEKKLPIDARRVYAEGMSNGGIFAQYLGCRRADLFAGIASVASSMPAGVTCKPSRPLSVIVIAGTADPVVPFAGGSVGDKKLRGGVTGTAATIAFWRRLDACSSTFAGGIPDRDRSDGSTARYSVAGGCKNATAVALITVMGGGHEWPGAAGSGSVHALGPRNGDFDATAAIWRFFAAGANAARDRGTVFGSQ